MQGHAHSLPMLLVYAGSSSMYSSLAQAGSRKHTLGTWLPCDLPPPCLHTPQRRTRHQAPAAMEPESSRLIHAAPPSTCTAHPAPMHASLLTSVTRPANELATLKHTVSHQLHGRQMNLPHCTHNLPMDLPQSSYTASFKRSCMSRLTGS